MTSPSNSPAMEKVRLAVIVTDVGNAVHGGGSVETTVRTFDLSPEAAEYIAIARSKGYSSVALAIEVQE